MSKFQKNTGWFWVPFICVIISEKMIAKANSLFRVATKNMGSEPIEKAGKYVIYEHDRPVGEGTNIRMIRRVVIDNGNELSFRGFGRDEDSSFENGIVFTAANAELLKQVTFEFDGKQTVEEMFQEAVLSQIYPAISPSKTMWNSGFKAALSHFVKNGKLFVNGDKFITLDEETITPSNVEAWLMNNCSGSLLTRVLGLKAVKVNTRNEHTSNRSAKTEEIVVPEKLARDIWA